MDAEACGVVALKINGSTADTFQDLEGSELALFLRNTQKMS